MKMPSLSAATLSILLAGVGTGADAAPGDAFVPAHRTKDGSFAPANVPPLSGGTHLARRPGSQGAKSHRVARSRQVALVPPLLVEARSLRR